VSGSVALEKDTRPWTVHVTSVLNFNDTSMPETMWERGACVAALRSRAAPRPPVSMTACGGKPVELGDGDWLGVAVCDEGQFYWGSWTAWCRGRCETAGDRLCR